MAADVRQRTAAPGGPDRVRSAGENVLRLMTSYAVPFDRMHYWGTEIPWNKVVRSVLRTLVGHSGSPDVVPLLRRLGGYLGLTFCNPADGVPLFWPVSRTSDVE